MALCGVLFSGGGILVLCVVSDHVLDLPPPFNHFIRHSNDFAGADAGDVPRLAYAELCICRRLDSHEFAEELNTAQVLSHSFAPKLANLNTVAQDSNFAPCDEILVRS